MAHARATHNLIVTRRMLDVIAEQCDRPELLRTILRLRWELLSRANYSGEIRKHCRQLPCILWVPPSDKDRTVQARFQGETTTGIMVSRVIFDAVWYLEPALERNEEILHSCGHGGAKHTHHGCCLNPAHLIRGHADDRLQLRETRRTMCKLNVPSVSVGLL